MRNWDSTQYLKFRSERTQPAIDLASRLKVDNPNLILDLGSGPGNSTRVLKDFFPSSRIIGLDSSEEMLDKARKENPEIEFLKVDISNDKEKLINSDILFSNACLQWIENHATLIPFLYSCLNDNGVLAVQIPINQDEPFFKVINEVINNRGGQFNNIEERNETLRSEEYYDILSSLSPVFEIWETVYYHRMKSIEDIYQWVKGTRLRPYLNVLNEREKIDFKTEILEKASTYYKERINGEVIFKFRRLFFTIQK